PEYAVLEQIRQFFLLLTQTGLGLLVVVDVNAGAEPSEHVPGTVAQENRASQVPAVTAIRATQAIFDLVRFAGTNRPVPSLQAGRPILGVHHFNPGRARRLVGRQAGVAVPVLIAVLHVAVRPRGPDDQRERLGHGAVEIGRLPL